MYACMDLTFGRYTPARMAPPPRLLVCDDAQGFRVLVQTIFEDAGFSVVGIASAWEEAVEQAGTAQPDVVLLDLWLPTFEPSGISRVRAAAPEALLVVISSLAVQEAVDLIAGIAGVDLVLSKRDPPATLVQRVRAALA
jgi:DNA-binding NarL/FixJ family response regulator